MPGGIVNSIVNATSKFAITQPHYFLIVMVLIIIIILYSKRTLNITMKQYPIFLTIFVIMLMSIVILATFLHVLQIHDSSGYIESFSNIFNSSGGRNFLAILSLVLFIIFIFEIPLYGNNNPYASLDKITLGNNSFISNRTVGILYIFFFTTMTAYTVMITTNESV